MSPTQFQSPETGGRKLNSANTARAGGHKKHVCVIKNTGNDEMVKNRLGKEMSKNMYVWLPCRRS